MITPRLPRPQDYTSPLHEERLAARLGLLLGIAFTVCFLTGLFSHLHQHPVEWLTLPTRPVWIYRLSQGLHVATGIAAIPLLVMKLWVVTPKFWKRPLIGGPVAAVERASILLLIASASFELITGLLNVAEYYPWSFFFPTVHYAVGWLAVAAIVVHIAVKLPVIRRALSSEPDHDGANNDPVEQQSPGRSVSPSSQGSNSQLTRRGVLVLAGGAAGVVTVATIGDRIPLFAPVSVAAQRSGRGPQGLPVNRTAVAAGVTAAARSQRWRLVVTGPTGQREFDLAALQALPQRTATLPLACVEGWSRNAEWTGVSFAEVLAAAGIDPADSEVVSLERGLYGRAAVPRAVAEDPLTLIALRLNGDELDIDHGYPARLIAPGRPGVLQTKWLSRIEVRT
ncbi:molybdopterin-dependent oxidoreductase [Williamsia sp. CHRR-6]|uniref:molybdopterin-dependent oxidoreductase n=1 Tax=Williamsia sp. CHRR-6 TaxID=2835871 RepID=UPI001BDB49C4|nr:molybdopterin-dependent oxidoreductase [Williamsia sp. CHRR-6]MBT0566370.1 molybdopterin-dependent oxidoreductase [Williamsia sp. CHRR-6]